MSQKTLSPLRLYALIALSLIGLAVSVYLTSHFYEIRSGGSSFRSLCNLGGKVNCDAVAASRYAELGLGIPLSSFAAGWFLALICIYFFAMGSEWRREAIRLATVMTGFSVLMGLIYLFVMIQVLGTYCLFCLGIDVASLLSFSILLSMKQEGLKKAPLQWSQWKVMGALTVGCLFVAVVALKGLDDVNLKSSDIDWQVQQVFNKMPMSVHTESKFPSFGPENAPVTIVEFSDFECPYCRLGALEVNTLIHMYPTQLGVVFRNFPLDMACNPKMDHPLHKASCEAARAALCANQQGKFGALYEELFEKQTSLEPGKPAEFAKELGLDMPKLEQCMANPDTQTAIQSDITEGANLGINSTPTFFINGRKIEGIVPVPVWSKLIESFAKP